MLASHIHCVAEDSLDLTVSILGLPGLLERERENLFVTVFIWIGTQHLADTRQALCQLSCASLAPSGNLHCPSFIEEGALKSRSRPRDLQKSQKLRMEPGAELRQPLRPVCRLPSRETESQSISSINMRKKKSGLTSKFHEASYWVRTEKKNIISTGTLNCVWTGRNSVQTS